MAHWRRGGIVVGGNKLHIGQAELEIIHSFLDEIGVFVADVAELVCGYAHKNNSAVSVAVARGLEPGIVGVAINFFLERFQDSHPGIGRRGSYGGGRGSHKWSKTPA